MDFDQNSHPPFTVGDIINGKPASYPGLDAIGDVGVISLNDGSLDDGTELARYVVIRLHKDKVTNEAITVDIQLVKSLNERLVYPNPNAHCYLHEMTFPCPACIELEKNNYGRAR